VPVSCFIVIAYYGVIASRKVVPAPAAE